MENVGIAGLHSSPSTSIFPTGPNEANPWPIVHDPYHFDCGEAFVAGQSVNRLGLFEDPASPPMIDFPAFRGRLHSSHDDR